MGCFPRARSLQKLYRVVQMFIQRFHKLISDCGLGFCGRTTRKARWGHCIPAEKLEHLHPSALWHWRRRRSIESPTSSFQVFRA